MTDFVDHDPQETQEWLDALESVLEAAGDEKAHFIIEKLIDKARRSGVNLPYSANTAYVNTIPVDQQERIPGDQAMEHKLRSYIRWNAMAMVVKANMKPGAVGGHIASFSSAATLYDVGFNHFYRGNDHEDGADMVFVQGHSAPGIYARSFLEGRLTEEQLDNFRFEVDGKGLSSYPHPWLMPDYWQFPTVSMGLGPILSIYQARFMKYMHHREIAKTAGRHVWAYLGDGEMDEPESLGAITLAGREKLDNLIFVVNCNLQRLDGPVRGNGKIIQELEALFRGAGWNVLKVIWGSGWDQLLARDTDGWLLKRMEEVVDGEYQNYKAKDGAYVRKHFFGKYPELLDMVSDMTDEDIWHLSRGGHDPRKIYAAYKQAVDHVGQPTVILAKTVKGYGLGQAGEGQNTTHQQKKMELEHMKRFRDRFNIPIPDDEIEEIPYIKLDDDSAEKKYLLERRKELGGFIPKRNHSAPALEIPPLSIFDAVLKDSGDRELSTTMAFVRILTALIRDKKIGKNIVPIVPDEARTFGMEGLFRSIGIYSSSGQMYEPEDSGKVMWYREDTKGQILEEGINEAGSMSEWVSAATAYSNYNVNMVPFYIYYSMFGFQRVGDLCWLAGDIQAKGFLIGGTAGRTTLNGEGLQHQDGHSLILANTIPNCLSYDPTYAYEMAVIVHEGMRRMYENQEGVFYYITAMNENYTHPAMPEGSEEGIIKGLYKLKSGGKHKVKAQLIGSGTILREVEAAAEMLEKDWNVSANVWSATSVNELVREGMDVDRYNRLHPTAEKKRSYISQCMDEQDGVVVASTDYMRLYAEQLRPWIKQRYVVLGTDGFGRSDTRERLRSFFEVDRYHVVVATLSALADEGTIKYDVVAKAIKQYKIDADATNPVKV
ncbi:MULTISPECIES: pyruvate dehydrogenase (acetyl-transferring), homodimeric type [unclassified Methylophaga]|jgi:pyruvate dehydrogenase E1 component|nr:MULTISPECIES: pyruvate dehydrogenase (acetyl-transferring), homodimeric type [unclassified Methylophaga]MAL49507.1 pyruvate dehydrogenase (acetyl-transferring), homodimeric type [Methylophaga sp.]MAP25729.1 pyruvate dehydrogenase (acetyl-transferring), homodimeric type [Methylophaga sp.]MBP25089.1 pyruvate dehydrogenase (acetyl-transferring), homodimeric type [Methylophaga sp.]HAD31159.1 pyruvate dehydrogenase (acetyl-transferring), homodimeric type [Methylophaga sp.]|tara:strand:- start:398 stop:3052 length:2655 start_codon:yes stop_codon:yes gene_type:complete